jgi:hypothetical protein
VPTSTVIAKIATGLYDFFFGFVIVGVCDEFDVGPFVDMPMGFMVIKGCCHTNTTASIVSDVAHSQ